MNWRSVRDSVLQGLLGGLLLVLIVLGLELAVAIPQWQRHSNELMEEIHAQSISALYTQAAVRKAIDGVQREVAGARMDLIARLELALSIAKIELDQANQTLYRTGYSLSRASASIAESVDRPAAGAAQIESQISDALVPLTNCILIDPETGEKTGNASCIQSRWAAGSKAAIDALGSADKAGQAWAASAPRQSAAATAVLENTAGATGHVEVITGRLAKKPSIWEKILGLAIRLRPW